MMAVDCFIVPTALVEVLPRSGWTARMNTILGVIGNLSVEMTGEVSDSSLETVPPFEIATASVGNYAIV
jgi:hypothetical protein